MGCWGGGGEGIVRSKAIPTFNLSLAECKYGGEGLGWVAVGGYGGDAMTSGTR